MKQYSDEELNAKIRSFITAKIAQHPELGDKTPIQTKADKVETYIFPKLMQSLTWIMPLVAR